jgi:teichuronic acid biosynthesis glycosyltransferase TuaC
VKVLVISHMYPSPAHPHPLFVHDQVRELRTAGVDAWVLCPTPYAPRALWRVSRLRERGTRPRMTVLDGVPVAYPRVFGIPRKILFARSGDLYYAGLRRGLAALARRGFDLVHAHPALPDGAAAARLAHRLDLPLVITVHGADAHVSLSGGGSVAAATERALRQAAAVVAVSQVLAARLAGVVPAERLHVIPNGVVVPEQPAAADDFLPGRRVVLSAGHLVESKGHLDVLDAIARLGAGYDNVHYVVVGEGPLRDRLATRAADLGLGERLHLLGQLDQARAFALMARADVFALPSSPEGFGLVCAEAMAQGTPVIACHGEGPETFIADGQSGVLVPPHDVKALADALAELLDDRERAAALGAAGRRAVAALTWEANARRQLEVYEQVLAARSAP